MGKSFGNETGICPNGLLDTLYGKEGHRGVNHPKGLGELQVSRGDMQGWGARLFRE